MDIKLNEEEIEIQFTTSFTDFSSINCSAELDEMLSEILDHLDND